METTRARTAYLGALAALLLWASGAGAESIGFLALAEGPVAVKAAGEPSFKVAAVDQDLAVGDTIRTGRGGLAKLVLADDTVITVDEETKLVMDRYAIGPLASVEPSRLELLAGHVRTKVGETFGGRTRLELVTPTAVIGVKGTEWLTWYRPAAATTWVCVVAGVVSAAGRGGDPGSIDLSAGHCARIHQGERPHRGSPPDELVPVPATRAATKAPKTFPAKLDPEPIHDRQVIEPGDNVHRGIDVPDQRPQSQSAPQLPSTPPPTRGN
jgi:hypothetical protein